MQHDCRSSSTYSITKECHWKLLQGTIETLYLDVMLDTDNIWYVSVVSKSQVFHGRWQGWMCSLYADIWITYFHDSGKKQIFWDWGGEEEKKQLQVQESWVKLPYSECEAYLYFSLLSCSISSVDSVMWHVCSLHRRTMMFTLGTPEDCLLLRLNEGTEGLWEEPSFCKHWLFFHHK